MFLYKVENHWVNWSPLKLFDWSPSNAHLGIILFFIQYPAVVTPSKDNFNWGIKHLKVPRLYIEIKLSRLTLSTQKFWLNFTLSYLSFCFVTEVLLEIEKSSNRLIDFNLFRVNFLSLAWVLLNQKNKKTKTHLIFQVRQFNSINLEYYIIDTWFPRQRDVKLCLIVP